MTDYPIVRFVSGLSSDASTRFDFHELGVSSTDPPAWVWTPGGLLGDPDSINPDYGFGRLDFELQVYGSRAESLAMMAALARELRRSSNFLLFEFDVYTPPAWLEVFPSSPGALGFPYAKPGTDGSVWVIPVSLTTGATWIGEQVSHSVTVANDPAVANGIAVTLPEIVGDAPAPLVVDMPLSSESTPILSVIPLDEPWPGAQFLQAEAMTPGAGASVDSSPPGLGFSAGSALRVLFMGGAGSAVRAQAQWAPVFAGTYKLMARVLLDGTLAVTVKGSGTACIDPTTTVVTTAEGIIELGTYLFPAGNMPTEKPYAVTSSAVTDVEIIASASSTAAGITFDYLVLVPVDLPLDQMEPARTLYGGSSSGWIRVNGEWERLTSPDGIAHASSTLAAPVGAFPRVTPGATNVLHFFSRRTIAGVNEDSVGDSRALTIKYRPRHVYLPGS